jgi:hypothetical protein
MHDSVRYRSRGGQVCEKQVNTKVMLVGHTQQGGEGTCYAASRSEVPIASDLAVVILLPSSWGDDRRSESG